MGSVPLFVVMVVCFLPASDRTFLFSILDYRQSAYFLGSLVTGLDWRLDWIGWDFEFRVVFLSGVHVRGWCTIENGIEPRAGAAGGGF